MMLTLHNTLTGKREAFTPRDPERVTMYVCGPTVYDYAHIGNARPVVVFDVLFRLLRHIYGEKHVKYARNITDIDDKIITAAAKEGVDIGTIARRYADIYTADVKALNALPPSLEPKATGTLPEMLGMIERLIGEGCAYVADGHVLFHVGAKQDYGKLSKRSREDMIAGARVEVAPYKKDPADFVLWKPSTKDQPGWASPWSRGRPGWHLECSCMAEKHLGATIDIHGGGQDLIFPHHENEIAQSECANKQPFARYWVHNGYLTTKGEKMSKSLGNIVTMHGLLEKFPGEALRLTLMSAHYRQPLDFSEAAVREQKRRLDRWYRITDGVKEGRVPVAVITALEDDLNTPEALKRLEALAKPETAGELQAGARFLGLLMKTQDEWFRPGFRVGVLEEKDQVLPITVREELTEEKIKAQIKKRNEARRAKDFRKADRIRADLEKQGVALEDGPGGTTWRRKD